MTGYYKLYWPNCPFYLIGQSTNVAKAVGNHLSALRNGTHTNIALQEIYNQYGFGANKIKDARFACPARELDNRLEAYLAEHNPKHNLAKKPGTATLTIELPTEVHDHYIKASNASLYSSPANYIRAMLINHAKTI